MTQLLIDGIDLSGRVDPDDVDLVSADDMVGNVVTFQSMEAFKESAYYYNPKVPDNDPGLEYWKTQGEPKLYVQVYNSIKKGIRVYQDVTSGGMRVELVDAKGNTVLAAGDNKEIVFENFCVVDNGYYMGKDGVTIYERVEDTSR